MKTLISIIIIILKALLPAMIDHSQPQHKDVDAQPKLKNKLKQKVRRLWAFALIFSLALFSSGCVKTVAIYVPDGEPVRLREPIKNAKVWVMVDGQMQATIMTIPDGWYCLPVGEENNE